MTGLEMFGPVEIALIPGSVVSASTRLVCTDRFVVFVLRVTTDKGFLRMSVALDVPVTTTSLNSATVGSITFE